MISTRAPVPKGAKYISTRSDDDHVKNPKENTNAVKDHVEVRENTVTHAKSSTQGKTISVSADVKEKEMSVELETSESSQAKRGLSGVKSMFKSVFLNDDAPEVTDFSSLVKEETEQTIKEKNDNKSTVAIEEGEEKKVRRRRRRR